MSQIADSDQVDGHHPAYQRGYRDGLAKRLVGEVKDEFAVKEALVKALREIRNIGHTDYGPACAARMLGVANAALEHASRVGAL